MIGRVFRYEFLQAYRRRSELVTPVVFFVLVCSMFPLALGSVAELLSPLAAGVIWVAALLATLLSLDQMFRQDFDEGILEQMELSEVPFYQMVAIKILAHWCLTGLPLVILSPLLAMMLFMPTESYLSLTLGLFLGTPILSLIGAIGAALTVKIRRGNVVLSLLIMPLYVPVLIFGATAPSMAAQGIVPTAQLLWLAAMLAMAATLAPLAASFGLRVNIYGS
jgi:heme exporter protein B